MKKWLKDRWAQCVAGFGILSIAITAILAHQADVPVDQSPEFRIISNTRTMLTADYAVTTDVGVVHMDAGFESDGASIPERTWSLLGLHPFSGCVVRAALVHDALVQGELCAMEDANIIFYELLIADGCQPDKAKVMYRAVCMAGPEVWARHTDASIAEARRWVRIKENTR